MRLAWGRRRHFQRSEFAAHNEIMRHARQLELENGQITLYGRVYTYQRLQQCGILVARDRMFSILHELDSVGMANYRLHVNYMPNVATLYQGRTMYGLLIAIIN